MEASLTDGITAPTEFNPVRHLERRDAEIDPFDQTPGTSRPDAYAMLAARPTDHQARRNACDRATRAALLIALFAICGCQSLQTRIDRYRAGRRIQRGQELLARQDYGAALAAFEDAVRLDPAAAEAHSHMGTIYRRMGDFGQAIAAFSSAVRAKPSFHDLFNLAELYHLTHRLKDAVQAYLAAIDFDPNHYDTRVGLGVCYQQLDEIELAAEQFNKAITLQPDRTHAYVNLGAALDTQGKHYSAIAAYQTALEQDQNQPLVLVNLAQTYVNQDRFKIAKATLDQAITMDPYLAPAHEALGYCLFRMHRYLESSIAYNDALSLDPRRAKAHVGLGSIKMLQYLKNKSRDSLREAALEHWHRALEADPNQPLVRDLIAKYERHSRDPLDALLGLKEDTP